MVHTKSKFSGGKIVKSGKVEVFDSNGEMLFAGQTDDNGEFSFKIPRITDLNIVLTAGMGHKNSWRLSADELGKGDTATDPAVQTRPDGVVPNPPEDTFSSLSESGISSQQIEEIISRQLEEELHRLAGMAAICQDKGPEISDIIGGIGYIVGLVGLGAYIRYRKESKKP